MIPTDLLLHKTVTKILTHPLIHWLAYFRKHKNKDLKVHIFEVDDDIKHRITTNVYLDTSVTFDELIVIVCKTFTTIEYFALIVPGHMNPFLLPEYPVMSIDLLQSIILPNFYRFQVREYPHEDQNQPLITDFNDCTYAHRYGGSKHCRRPTRRRSCSL